MTHPPASPSERLAALLDPASDLWTAIDAALATKEELWADVCLLRDELRRVVELPERFVDVAWSRPESREILRCYGLTVSEFVNRLVAASRNYGPGVEIVSIAYTIKRATGSDGGVR